jgi:hypothetical protein
MAYIIRTVDIPDTSFRGHERQDGFWFVEIIGKTVTLQTTQITRFPTLKKLTKDHVILQRWFRKNLSRIPSFVVLPPQTNITEVLEGNVFDLEWQYANSIFGDAQKYLPIRGLFGLDGDEFWQSS